MRSWLTTQEVRVMLGGITQGRVSQLVKSGVLVVERDSEGRYRYDRISAEKYAQNKAAHAALHAEGADERAALQAEARDRFKRQRDRERAAEAERQAHFDELREREVKALEGIHECLRRR